MSIESNSSSAHAPLAIETLDPPSLDAINPEAATIGSPASHEDDTHNRPKLSFWQDPVVQNYLPLGTSVAFHLILIIGGVLSYKTYQKITQPLREQIIIPEAAMVEGGEVGGIPNPGLGSDPNMAAAQNVDSNVAVADKWADKRSESLTTTLMNGGASDDATDSVIGLGARGGVTGSGAPGPGGAGGEGTEALAPFGVPGGGQGLGPKSPFMGISGNARTVVYICDASGTMMSVFPRVQQELVKSVGVLKPIQGFNVIFFAGSNTEALSKDSLIMATPDNKRKAFDFANHMFAHESTEPLTAIRLALSEQPDLIYILTDGFESMQGTTSGMAVADEIKKLNKDHKVRINTILIASNSDRELEKVVRRIAAENGGQCKIIDRQSM